MSSHIGEIASGGEMLELLQQESAAEQLCYAAVGVSKCGQALHWIVAKLTLA